MKSSVDILIECIKAAIQSNEFKWDIFFKKWFRDFGCPLFFLFKKNLAVTNTQYVELFSLLTKYCTREIEMKVQHKLLFYTTEHIKTSFSEVLSSILEDYDPKDDRKLVHFAKQYHEIFNATVAVDMLFGSCAVFLPPGVKVELDRIVFDSGYIHSAGKSLFIRNIVKSKKADFLNTLEEFLKNNPSDQLIPFVVYSHEDFSDFDQQASDLIFKGIEQCKIFVEKMNMGSFRLSTIIKELQTSEKFRTRLLVPEAGNYIQKHKFKGKSTLWLISDRSISSNQLKNPGQGRYYICYEQEFKNDSPFFYFDENKPAWKSHTTIPHSLAAALINSSRMYLNHGRIADPFGGTGTTWFEAKRLNLENEVICSDLSPITQLLVHDNLEFFLLNEKDLKLLKQELKTCIPEKALPPKQLSIYEDVENPSIYRAATALLNKLIVGQEPEDQEYEFSQGFVDELGTYPFPTRIAFYVALRAKLRFHSGFTRNSITFETAFTNSLKKLVDQINMFIELRDDISENKDLDLRRYFFAIPGTYSSKLIPSLLFRKLDSFLSKAEVISSKNALELEKSSCDLIICDPPYGFNTNQEILSLSELYWQFIEIAIDALRPHGQLIVCLPAESYTGRDLPYCTRSDLVSREIILKAHEKGRKVYRPAISIPNTALTPPYYWESDKALRRSILHFNFL